MGALSRPRRRAALARDGMQASPMSPMRDGPPVRAAQVLRTIAEAQVGVPKPLGATQLTLEKDGSIATSHSAGKYACNQILVKLSNLSSRQHI